MLSVSLASFCSYSGCSDLDAEQKSEIKTNAVTLPGMYGLSYGYDPIASLVTYKLSNGLNIWENSYHANSVPAARTVVFDNGFTVTTAADTDERAPISGVEIINVESGNQVTINFQVGTSADDIIDIQFKPATVLALNLSGTDISDKDSIVATAYAIDSALIEVAHMIAKLGGTKEQLTCAKNAYDLQHRFSDKG